MCSIPFCEYKGLKVSTFGIPKDNSKKLEWETVLGTELKVNSRVCQYHFKKEDISNTWESGQGSNKYTICLKRPKLRPGAIPIQLKPSAVKNLSLQFKFFRKSKQKET